jgi:hypothetical protein
MFFFLLYLEVGDGAYEWMVSAVVLVVVAVVLAVVMVTVVVAVVMVVAAEAFSEGGLWW